MIADSTPTATRQSTMMNSRDAARSMPATRMLPCSQAGAPTSTLGAPKMLRASCCRISETPQVTSRVSSGRWYIRRISVASRITPSRPPTTKPTGMAISSEMPASPSRFCMTYAV